MLKIQFFSYMSSIFAKSTLLHSFRKRVATEKHSFSKRVAAEKHSFRKRVATEKLKIV